MTRPNPHIALIYHYDLARALNGEPVDWAAIPVNVDAGREGGDLCRAAADFAKRRDLFAMPAPKIEAAGSGDAGAPVGQPPRTAVAIVSGHYAASREWSEANKSAVPPSPNPAVEQQAADPEPSTASTAVPGTAVQAKGEPCNDSTASSTEPQPSSSSTTPAKTTTAPANTSTSSPTTRSTSSDNSTSGFVASDRTKLRFRIFDLVQAGHEQQLRHHWPEGVPTLKHDGHSDAQLQLILACVRRVEAEVGAGWHPDDGPPPHVNTDPRAEIPYSKVLTLPSEGGVIPLIDQDALQGEYRRLTTEGMRLCKHVAREANEAGRSISVETYPTVRRWSIARAVIAWAASGRTLDELWFAASNLATFEQCRDPSATLGGLISQFTIEQADRLYESATIK